MGGTCKQAAAGVRMLTGVVEMEDRKESANHLPSPSLVWLLGDPI